MSLLKKDYTIPNIRAPPYESRLERRPPVTLSQLPTGRYINTIVRVASLKVKDIEDKLGPKRVFSGVLEDSTFKVPFLCHKTSLPLEKNLILRIYSAYVHEFEDHSQLLVLTEHSRARPLYSEDIQEYVWVPMIGRIHRPVWDVNLKGTVSNVYGSSGLVRRCNRCKTIVYEKCLNGCESGWDWDVRTSALLYDGSGSIKMILGRYLTSRLLNRRLSEMLLLAKVQNITTPEGYDVLSFNLEVPEFDVMEAMVEDAHRYRRHDSIIIPEGDSRVYFMPGEEIPDAVTVSERRLDPQNREDFRVVRRLVEKALEIRIHQITGNPRAHGLHLLEDPIPLYGAECAKLYLGFSTRVINHGGRIILEAAPQGLVRESVWDYVGWRRRRGASARSIERTILRDRANVILAPNGHYGRIEKLIYKRAGEERVSEMDGRTFTQFWKETYDYDVAPEEIPLLRVRLMRLDILLTYPPSCVYFDDSNLFLTAGVQRFIGMKRASLKRRVQAVVNRALKELKIGEVRVECLGESGQRVDVQRLLVHDIRRKLLGRTVEARGNVTQLKDRFYFFPQRVLKVT
ncbi:MAG: hypothetical protein ACE5Z5_10835 [Candidatus Bathyarchaeia archaeon]